MRLRPIFFGVALVVVAVVVLAILISRTATAPDRSLLRVQQAGELSIGIDPSYPPFEVDNGSGQLAGFDIDLVTELARRLGVKARFISIDFGGIYDALGVAKFDLIVGGVSPPTDGDPQLAFTRSYYDDGLVVVLGPESLGTVLGIESGSDADLELVVFRDQLGGFTFRPFDDQDQIRAAIESRTLRGAIVDRVTASQWSHSVHDLTISPRNLTSVPYVLEGRRGDQELIHSVDHALQMMFDDGFVSSLDRKWVRS